MSDKITPAHTQKVHLDILEFFPDHEPRESDPHYHLFNDARAKLKAAGKWVCWACGKTEAQVGSPLEAHHSTIEFALANGVDVLKFKERFPEFNVSTDEELFAFVEGESNLTILCTDHHRGLHGIHSLPYPCWVAQAFWKDGLPAPGVVDK